MSLFLPLGYFFIGEDRSQTGTPVHWSFGDIGEPDIINLLLCPALLFQLSDGSGLLGRYIKVAIVNLQEDPLGPPDVSRISGIYLAIPVVTEAKHLKLAPEVIDVVLGVDSWMFSGLPGVLLRGQPKCIPAHWVENIESTFALIAGDNVCGGVAFGMAYMQASSARVGEHVEGIEFGCRSIEIRVAGPGHAEGLVLVPPRLPLCLESIEWVGFTSVAHVRFVGPERGRDGGR